MRKSEPTDTECGCHPFNAWGGHVVTYCPLHEAAQEMVEMLYTLLPCAEDADKFNKPTKKYAPMVRALIAKAEGR